MLAWHRVPLHRPSFQRTKRGELIVWPVRASVQRNVCQQILSRPVIQQQSRQKTVPNLLPFTVLADCAVKQQTMQIAVLCVVACFYLLLLAACRSCLSSHSSPGSVCLQQITNNKLCTLLYSTLLSFTHCLQELPVISQQPRALRMCQVQQATLHPTSHGCTPRLPVPLAPLCTLLPLTRCLQELPGIHSNPVPCLLHNTVCATHCFRCSAATYVSPLTNCLQELLVILQRPWALCMCQVQQSTLHRTSHGRTPRLPVPLASGTPAGLPSLTRLQHHDRPTHQLWPPGVCCTRLAATCMHLD
jgi:hypothetical protein